ncbi:Uncharacterized ACR, COG1678 [Serratia odorifera]|uniref:Uncharacterized ACR, COG1678 n=1 Tax=Serratia odorifera TaxID=618 RepID=A0A447KRM5_SEROD|nr:Uncharacterized ACR, COG1678 [Serratia odorifera]
MNLQHHFLIAMPTMQDPRFKRSVIYICEHNEEGAMGLVINKPVEQFTVESVLSKLQILPIERDPAVNLDKPVFAGGPLADDRGFILHTPCSGFWLKHSDFAGNHDNHLQRRAGNPRYAGAAARRAGRSRLCRLGKGASSSRKCWKTSG